MVAQIQWGTAGEWAGALGTLLAFGAALLLLRHERDLRQEDRQHARQAQAEKVSAWVVENTHGDHTVNVRNASDAAVVAVTATLYDLVTDAHRDISVGALAPGHTEFFHVAKVGDLPAVDLSFIDSANVEWIRTAREGLREANPARRRRRRRLFRRQPPPQRPE